MKKKILFFLLSWITYKKETLDKYNSGRCIPCKVYQCDQKGCYCKYNQYYELRSYL